MGFSHEMQVGLISSQVKNHEKIKYIVISLSYSINITNSLFYTAKFIIIISLLILSLVFLSDEFSIDLVTYSCLCNHFFTVSSVLQKQEYNLR